MITRNTPALAWIVSALLAIGASPLPAQDAAAQTNASATAPGAKAGTAGTQSSRAPSSEGSGYAAFKIIADRNIFNGNRSGQVIRSTRSSSQQRSVRVDSFALVGTMITEKGPMAFFDGTESGFRKAARPGDSIAGFKIQEILQAGVRLAQGTNTTDLRVGSGMRREDEGLWKHASSGLSFASGSSEGQSSSRSSYSSSRSNGYSSRDRSSSGRSDERSDSRSENTGSDTASSANVDEVLKRLMEKRERE